MIRKCYICEEEFNNQIVNWLMRHGKICCSMKCATVRYRRNRWKVTCESMELSNHGGRETPTFLMLYLWGIRR